MNSGITKIYKKSVWIESDICGNKHVMAQHETEAVPFQYCTFFYNYAHTSNAETRASAEQVALMIGASEPVECRRRVIK